MVAAERLAERRVPEATVRVFGEDAEARERSQQAAQRRAMRPGSASQLVRTLGSPRHEVGNAELRGDVDRLDDERAGQMSCII
jgi:hypothetical protein